MGMVLDGIAASEQPDSSAEVLDVKGCDISDLTSGRGTLNWEHRGSEAPGASANDHIGRIIKAKKVFAREDCENAREREYWDFVQVPFIYIQAELFDAEDHPGAKAAAAMVRHYRKHGIPILIRYSIEGATLAKDGQRLARTMARHVAATIKPANKSCISGVVSDGGEQEKEEGRPDDPLAFLIGEDTKKFENPDRMRLGGSVTIACDPECDAVANLVTKVTEVKKAMSAGMPAGAPGTLTGGAALQREDLGQFRNRAKAALRDYDPDRHGPFRTYLAHELPDACPEFLDRFTEAVGDWKVTRQAMLSKAAPAGPSLFGDALPTQQKPAKPPKPKAQQDRDSKKKKHQARVADIRQEAETMLPGMGGLAPAVPPSETPEFKVQKRRTLAPGEAFFEHEYQHPMGHQLGVVHTADGSFPVYHPRLDDRGYGEVLQDPELNAIHDHALKNWVMLHRLVRSGRLPHEVVALAALFSAMSPNTPVPVQELAYGHLMDMMGAPNGKGGWRGFDPTQEHGRQALARYAREWNSIVKGQKLPAWEHDHFAQPDSGIWTAEGNRYKIGLGKQKWDGAANYHDLHNFLTSLVDKYGADGRAIAGELNRAKQVAGTQRQVEGEPEVMGFAPKTIRYLLGMLGAGNVVVPDTHFIRHTFGLLKGDPKNDTLKKYLWNSKNEPLLAELDRHYYLNHPAVQHTREKLQQQYGEDFGEHSIFPAFWLHWLSIQPHEERRGWDSAAQNAGTDHAVYWNAVARVLRKYGIPTDPRLLKSEGEESASIEGNGSMAARVAHAMKELENQFGTTPAYFALYSHMLPALLNSSQESMVKAELLTQELRDLAKGEPRRKKKEAAPQPFMFRGQAVEPGELEIIAGPQKGNRFPLVGVGSDWHHVVNQTGSLMKVNPESPGIRINRPPRALNSLGSGGIVGPQHGIPGMSETPEQQDLLHGLDLSAKAFDKLPGQQTGTTERHGYEPGWYRSAAGLVGYVKPSRAVNRHMADRGGQAEFSSAHREAAFYRLAHDFFGLGEHVPVTSAFTHPVTKEPHSVQQMVHAGEHYNVDDEAHDAALHHLGNQGTLDKLALMDMILDSADRHPGNYMLTPGEHPYLHLIDNGLTLAPHGRSIPGLPDYWQTYHVNQHGPAPEKWMQVPLHPEAERWALGLNQDELGDQMAKLGVPERYRVEAQRRLAYLQGRLQRGNTSRGAAYFAPFTGAEYYPEHTRSAVNFYVGGTN